MEIRKVKEHYEVYEDNQFQFSADTLREVNEEMEEHNGQGKIEHTY